jgi:hypothetical protein
MKLSCYFGGLISFGIPTFLAVLEKGDGLRSVSMTCFDGREL